MISPLWKSIRSEPRREFTRRKRDLLAREAQRLDTDHARIGFVIADDQREARAARVRALHLRAKVSAAGVDGDREPGVAQVFGHFEREPCRAFADVNDVGVRRVACRPAVLLEQKQDALDTDAESTTR